VTEEAKKLMEEFRVALEKTLDGTNRRFLAIGAIAAGDTELAVRLLTEKGER
jgi:hypothetical protein